MGPKKETFRDIATGAFHWDKGNPPVSVGGGLVQLLPNSKYPAYSMSRSKCSGLLGCTLMPHRVMCQHRQKGWAAVPSRTSGLACLMTSSASNSRQ